MTDEDNYYLIDLEKARTKVQQEIDTLLGDDTSLEQPIVKRIAEQGGWVCTEADEWITDLKGKCGPALKAFNDVLADLDTVIETQRAHPTVPEGNWRGLKWKNGH